MQVGEEVVEIQQVDQVALVVAAQENLGLQMETQVPQTQAVVVVVRETILTGQELPAATAAPVS